MSKETLAQAFERIIGHTPEEAAEMLGIKVEPQEELISRWCNREHNYTTWRRLCLPETATSSAVRIEKCATCGLTLENLG